MSRLAAMAAITCLAAAAGTNPKPKVDEYPVHLKTTDLGIAAEYMVRTVFLDKQSITTDKYLVVEVALYPDPGRDVTVNAQHFTLRLNGKKDVRFPQAPSFVAASLKYSDWGHQRGVVASAGPVIIGRPAPVERFPGDNRDRNRMPRQSGGDAPEIDIAEELNRIALQEGPTKKAVSGYLFFAFDGKLKSLKQVELLYQAGPGDPVVLRLR
jgi:hypothetical protein